MSTYFKTRQACLYKETYAFIMIAHVHTSNKDPQDEFG